MRLILISAFLLGVIVLGVVAFFIENRGPKPREKD